MIVDDRSDTLSRCAAVVDQEGTEEQLRVLHKTIRAVTQDLQTLDFNTAIARMMEFVNFFTRQTERPRCVMQSFVLLLSPFAPHISEELWLALGNSGSLAYEPWPVYDESLARDTTIEIPVQVLGKLRGKIQVAADIAAADLVAAAKADAKVAPWLEGKTIVKEIVVPGRLVNFVVK